MHRGFRGSSPLALDAKGRMAVPAKYRERLREACGGRLVITISREPCLQIYPLPEWEKLEAQVDRMPGMDSRVANFKRRFFGCAEDCDMDGQGRLLIPARLRQTVDLGKQAVLVGVVNKFELWSQARWDALNETGLAEDLQDLDLPDALRNFAL